MKIMRDALIVLCPLSMLLLIVFAYVPCDACAISEFLLCNILPPVIGSMLIFMVIAGFAYAHHSR